ncbi:hypothetical protein LZ30DRAFT_182437 [Colletotrichum cereale]|nr:hypothetical protein LZ30DRAFT_182437 [Colletotrichum cereale]
MGFSTRVTSNPLDFNLRPVTRPCGTYQAHVDIAILRPLAIGFSTQTFSVQRRLGILADFLHRGRLQVVADIRCPGLARRHRLRSTHPAGLFKHRSMVEPSPTYIGSTSIPLPSRPQTMGDAIACHDNLLSSFCQGDDHAPRSAVNSGDRHAARRRTSR